MNPRGVVLAALTAIFGCSDTEAPNRGADQLVRLAMFRDQMCACKDTTCAKKVSADMASWGRGQPSDKPAALSTSDQAKASEIGIRLGECMMRATAGTQVAAGSGAPPTATGSAAPPPAPVKNTQGLPKECDDYKAAIDRLATCESLSAAARETFVKGYQDSAARWSSMPEASKATLATACQGGVEAVLAVAKARCGW